MKRIAVVSQFFPPETNAGANRALALASALAKEYRVLVVSTEPSYPDPGIFKDVDMATLDSELPFEILRTGSFKPHAGGMLVRGYRELGRFRRLAEAGRPWRPDLMIATSPSMFLGPFGLGVAKNLKIPFIWDIRDLTWQYAVDKPSSNPLVRIGRIWLKRLMTRTVRAADFVTCTNQGMEQVLRTDYGRNEQVMTIENGISRHTFDALSSMPPREMGDRRLQITYVGVIGHMQAIDVLLDAARLLPQMDFHLVGDGATRHSLEAETKAGGLMNVQFHGYQDSSGVRQAYAGADLLIGHLIDTEVLARTALPSKIFEYMATGRPFVFGCRGFAADFLERHGLGPTFLPGDAGEMARAILDATEHLDEGTLAAASAQAYVGKHLIREDAARGMVDIARSLLSANSNGGD